MNHYIKEIYIKKLRHLSDIKIELNNEHMQHLLLTGKNGSGKTSLLIALAEKLNNICNDIDEKEISDIQNGIEVFTILDFFKKLIINIANDLLTPDNSFFIFMN